MKNIRARRWVTVILIGALVPLMLFALLALVETASAATMPQKRMLAVRFVATSGTDAGNDCLVDTAPCRTIQHAIEAAQSGDTILVAAGLYTGTMSASPTFTATIVLSKSLRLLGGYDLSTWIRPPPQYSILDGQFLPAGVVAVVNGQANIQGFRIENGRAPNGSGIMVTSYLGPAEAVIYDNIIQSNHTIQTDDYEGHGAGILVTDGARAQILNNKIQNNVIDDDNGYGAGISIRNGATAIISGNQILNNHSHPGTGDGAIGVYASTVQIINNLIRGNSVQAIGLYDNPSVLISGNQIVSNTATHSGAGIWAGNGAVDPSHIITIENNLIAYNRIISAATAPEYAEGAGLYIGANANVRLIGNDIRQNSIVQPRASGGAGIRVNNAYAEIRNNSIVSNTVALQSTGGGISLDGAQAGIISNTISGNLGAGIWAWEGVTMTVISNTIARNRAEYDAGIFVFANSVVTITSNTISQNEAKRGAGFGGYQLTSRVVISNNLFSHNIASEAGGAIKCDDCGGRLEIYNNTIFSNTAAYGAGLHANGPGVLVVRHNTFEQNTSSDGPGAINIFEGPSAWVDGNRIIGNIGYSPAYSPAGGVQIDQTTRPVTVTNNLIALNTNDGIQVTQSDQAYIGNNTIVSNTNFGIHGYAELASGSMVYTATNNIVSGSGDCGILGSREMSATLSNNLVWRNGYDLCANVQSSGEIYADPRFLNAAVGDYHLTVSSPAIDTGINTLLAEDFEHDVRPIGAGIDIGYDEHQPYDLNIVTIPTTATVSLHGANGNVQLAFPAGTFLQTVIVTLTTQPTSTLPPAPQKLILINGYVVSAVYASSGLPAQPAAGQSYKILVFYDDAGMTLNDELALKLYAWDGSMWVPEATQVNTENNSVLATPNHFSRWAVIGPRATRIYLPLVRK